MLQISEGHSYSFCTLNYSPKKLTSKINIFTQKKQETINNLIGQKRAKLKSSERRGDAMSSGEDGVWLHPEYLISHHQKKKIWFRENVLFAVKMWISCRKVGILYLLPQSLSVFNLILILQQKSKCTTYSQHLVNWNVPHCGFKDVTFHTKHRFSSIRFVKMIIKFQLNQLQHWEKQLS